MQMLPEERVFCGNNITVIKRDEDCTMYKIKDVTVEGIITRYQVFPGIDLMYNDFHMPSCFSEFRPKAEMIGIDHCREGRIEWEFQNSSYMYLQEGDLQINAKDHHAMGFGFPLSHYHGITVAVYIEEASKNLVNIFDGFSVDFPHSLIPYLNPLQLITIIMLSVFNLKGSEASWRASY